MTEIDQDDCTLRMSNVKKIIKRTVPNNQVGADFVGEVTLTVESLIERISLKALEFLQPGKNKLHEDEATQVIDELKPTFDILAVSEKMRMQELSESYLHTYIKIGEEDCRINGFKVKNGEIKVIVRFKKEGSDRFTGDTIEYDWNNLNISDSEDDEPEEVNLEEVESEAIEEVKKADDGGEDKCEYCEAIYPSHDIIECESCHMKVCKDCKEGWKCPDCA